jgi:polar amino acid transport system permease protein
VDEFESFFRWLHQAHGLNFSVAYDAYDRAQYLSGLWTTIKLSVLCIGVSLVIGVIGAWAQGARFAPVRWAMHAYVAFFRNTPPLIQLYFFFFAIGSVLPALIGADGARPLVSNFAWAVIALSFFAGALNVEIFRSGLEAVPQTTVEAAESLGYTRLQAYVHVVLPLRCGFRFQRSAPTWSISPRPRRWPMPSPCRNCSMSARRSGRSSST